MKQLTKNAREFVDDVVKYIKTDAKSPVVQSELKSALLKVSAEDKSQNEAHVVSAVSLSELEKQEIHSILVKVLGHEIELRSEVDTSMIGGFKITVGDWIFDSSIKNQLDNLRSYLL